MGERGRGNELPVWVAFVIFATGLFVWLVGSENPMRPLGLPRGAAYAVAAAGLLAFWWVAVLYKRR